MPNTTKKNRKIWLPILSIFFVCTALFFYNKHIITLYYYNIKKNHYNAGDKVYLSKKCLENFRVFNLYQVVEPINGNGEIFAIASPWGISIDSLRKYNTGNIGVYIQYNSLKLNAGEKYSQLNFYGITTNKKALIKTNLFGELPSGYKYADAPFYIPLIFTSITETIK